MRLEGATAANCHTVRQSSFYQQRDSAFVSGLELEQVPCTVHSARRFTLIREQERELDYHSQWDLPRLGSNCIKASPKGKNRMMSKLLNRRNVAIAALAAIALLVCLSGTAQAPSGQGPAAQVPSARGSVEGAVYVDPRFGLRYTFPASLEVQTSLNGMPVGTGQRNGNTEYLFAALEKPTGQVRSGVFITADPVGVLEVTNVEQYMRLMIGQSPMFKGKVELQPVLIAGRTFYRAYSGGSSGGDTPTRFYGAQVGTSCNGQFIIFWFSGPSRAVIDQLVQSMDSMKLTCPAD
jgi:hypothetical protein